MSFLPGSYWRADARSSRRSVPEFSPCVRATKRDTFGHGIPCSRRHGGTQGEQSGDSDPSGARGEPEPRVTVGPKVHIVHFQLTTDQPGTSPVTSHMSQFAPTGCPPVAFPQLALAYQLAPLDRSPVRALSPFVGTMRKPLFRRYLRASTSQNASKCHTFRGCGICLNIAKSDGARRVGYLNQHPEIMIQQCWASRSDWLARKDTLPGAALPR